MSLPPGALKVEPLQLPPTVFVAISWSKLQGKPDDMCGAFRVLVEGRGPTKFSDLGGGRIDADRADWKKVAVSPTCKVGPEDEDSYSVVFNIPVDNYAVFPEGGYRVKAQLAKSWDKADPKLLVGPLHMYPLSWVTALWPNLTEEHPILSVEYEVHRGREFVSP